MDGSVDGCVDGSVDGALVVVCSVWRPTLGKSEVMEGVVDPTLERPEATLVITGRTAMEVVDVEGPDDVNVVGLTETLDLRLLLLLPATKDVDINGCRVLFNGLVEKEVVLRDGPKLAVDVLWVWNTEAVEGPPL